ncbi:prepilin peptidase [Rhodopirellula sp. MGV]|uniref:A24 family peptidase n=1 Tax=Rhodopirellula sp. MGV TaxID=2023130 RepID=UPI000B971E93|nr:A24 family peptidase [Rhodopirellula sp. MGV]OYP37700.1 hypothetical protein CGZ80_04235 [Rhodopirellula sp. MGV]PNY37138.1 prepilin peptidase [Rhodopirellula baltica]
MDLNYVPLVAMIAFTSVATAMDLKSRRIPNWLTVTTAILGLVWNLYAGHLSGLLTSLGGFATGFGILCTLWLIGGGGGGDVKMMGAIGAWLGPIPTLIVFLASTGYAIVCTVAMLVWGAASPKMQTAPAADSNESAAVLKHAVPYALPVALSVWSLLLFHLVR